ncbi:MAG: hypothetical protein JXK94_13710 [Deltaproteobacteria bacterium]|nr:hypothetical protein [Deltaproteobacteria bacterium]
MKKRSYLTTEEVADRLPYTAKYIRSILKDRVFLEGIHYIRPFGRKKVLYIWEAVEEEMVKASETKKPSKGVAKERSVNNG